MTSDKPSRFQIGILNTKAIKNGSPEKLPPKPNNQNKNKNKEYNKFNLLL
jgi:hypothetical protein